MSVTFGIAVGDAPLIIWMGMDFDPFRRVGLFLIQTHQEKMRFLWEEKRAKLMGASMCGLHLELYT